MQPAQGLSYNCDVLGRHNTDFIDWSNNYFAVQYTEYLVWADLIMANYA